MRRSTRQLDGMADEGLDAANEAGMSDCENNTPDHERGLQAAVSQPDPCSICLEPITDRAIPAPCNHHTFDYMCLLTWLQNSTCCPMCKREITIVNYDFRGPNDIQFYEVRRMPPLSSRPLLQSYWHGQSARPGHNAMNVVARYEEYDDALERRKFVYSRLLYSYYIGSNHISRFRNFTPAQITESGELQSKARKWIRRELRVFGFLTQRFAHQAPVNLEWLIEFIVCILRTVDLSDISDQAHLILTESLGRENARLFLHDLSTWMRSPYRSLEEWDRFVEYGLEYEGFKTYQESRFRWPRNGPWARQAPLPISVVKR